MIQRVTLKIRHPKDVRCQSVIQEEAVIQDEAGALKE